MVGGNELDVVICTYNNAAVLDRVLHALAAQRPAPGPWHLRSLVCRSFVNDDDIDAILGKHGCQCLAQKPAALPGRDDHCDPLGHSLPPSRTVNRISPTMAPRPVYLTQSKREQKITINVTW